MPKEIVLSNGAISLVDDEDYPEISRWRWKPHRQGYACRTGYKNKKFILILMHRLINDTPIGLETDHLNGNKLDNRKSNLQTINTTIHRRKHIAPLVQHQKSTQIYPDIKKCVVCASEFKVNPRKRNRNKCCSLECAMNLRIKGRLRQCGKL